MMSLSGHPLNDLHYLIWMTVSGLRAADEVRLFPATPENTFFAYGSLHISTAAESARFVLVTPDSTRMPGLPICE